MPVDKTLVQTGEELLPRIDSIFLGTLSGDGAREVIREGISILRELKQMASCRHNQSLFLLIESLQESIKEARKELKRCER
ncbi:MAG TPA: hypothetical protein VMV71_03540 [Candidatus Paceibacterota bacterium]|nr:hypothetical protein [Candidatus Paceibacterota bacterium]